MNPSHSRPGVIMDNLLTFCAGLAVAIVLIGLKNNPVLKSGIFPHWCPNMASVIGVPFCWLGYFICWVMFQNIYLAMIIYAPGVSTDLMDGRMARAHAKAHPNDSPGPSFWEQFFFRGESKLGQVVDPLCDKARIVPPYLHVAFLAFWGDMYTTGSLFAIIAALETWAAIHRLKNWKAHSEKNGNRANDIGKAKTVGQHVALGLWVAHCFDESVALMTTLITLLLFVLILTVASPLLRARAARTVKENQSPSPLPASSSGM